MELIDKIKALFSKKNKPDVIEFKESHYCAVINDQMSWYDSKEAMLNFIESYSKTNTIYSLSMFRYDLFNLIK